MTAPSADARHRMAQGRLCNRPRGQRRCETPRLRGFGLLPQHVPVKAATSGTGLFPPRTAPDAVPDGSFRVLPGRSWSQAGGFAYPIVREAAESTDAVLGIPASELSGYAHALEVASLGSYLAGPGCALCSAAIACDPQRAAWLLREVFRSGPAGSGH
jgi:hypothetical protein